MSNEPIRRNKRKQQTPKRYQDTDFSRLNPIKCPAKHLKRAKIAQCCCHEWQYIESESCFIHNAEENLPETTVCPGSTCEGYYKKGTLWYPGDNGCPSLRQAKQCILEILMSKTALPKDVVKYGIWPLISCNQEKSEMIIIE